MQSETLAQEFSRLVKEYHEGDDHTKPEAWNLLADYAVDNADAISAALSDKQAGEVKALHRLDVALCNFINAYGDPYDPPEEYEAETKRNIKELSDAYNAAHSVGVFFEHASLVDVSAVEPVGYVNADFRKELSCYDCAELVPNDRSTASFKYIPLYAIPLSEGEDSAKVDIPADLVKRCEEVLDWHQTGILQDGGELRLLAGRIRKMFNDTLSQGEALSHAEEKTEREAMRLIIALAATRSGSATTSKGCAE